MRLEWRRSTIRPWLRFELRPLPGSASHAHQNPESGPSASLFLSKCETQGCCRSLVRLYASLRPGVCRKLSRALRHAVVHLFRVDDSRTYARLRAHLSQDSAHCLLLGEGKLEPQHTAAARPDGLRL